MASLGIWVGRDLPSLNHIPYLRYEATIRNSLPSGRKSCYMTWSKMVLLQRCKQTQL